MPQTQTDMPRRRLVSVLDDDDSVRRGLCNLLRSLGYQARDFPSAQSFLHSSAVHDTDCLLLDVIMPGMGGIELQRALREQGQACPIIFITAYVDDAMQTTVQRRGAIGTLCKPFREDELLALMDTAFSRHAREHH